MMRPDKSSSDENTSEKLTILFVPLDGHGHFNACIGLGQPLLKRGHNVVFATPNGWNGKLAELGFQEEWYSTADPSVDTKSTQSDTLNNVVEQMSFCLAMSPKEQTKCLLSGSYPMLKSMMVNGEPQLRNILTKIKPDVIVLDNMYSQPALVTAGKQ